MSHPIDKKYQKDLILARRIVSGSVEDWHRFIDEYSGRILYVIQSYLSDSEDVRDIYIDLLERLYKGHLGMYEGRSSLATWLVCITRNSVMDFLRSRHGRRVEPPEIKEMSGYEQEVFKLFHIEGKSYDSIRHHLRAKGMYSENEFLAETLCRIEEKISNRVMRRIIFDLHAGSVGLASGRLLEFIEQSRRESERRVRNMRPDRQLQAKETARNLERIWQAIDRFPEMERQVLVMRFKDGVTAREIAQSVGLKNTREAFSIIDRVLKRVRSSMDNAAS
ncbi:MAG: sigma-70 family RNA polymerase sigma factor [bacterium]|nr:sigma-70 family RNA polymerase sigma factor [bacterium]